MWVVPAGSSSYTHTPTRILLTSVAEDVIFLALETNCYIASGVTWYEFRDFANVPLVAASEKLFHCSKLLTFVSFILLNYKMFGRSNSRQLTNAVVSEIKI